MTWEPRWRPSILTSWFAARGSAEERCVRCGGLSYALNLGMITDGVRRAQVRRSTGGFFACSWPQSAGV